jgi:hypothetical protein
MNLDQNLRTMLRERAEGVAATPVVPERTVRRVRVRKALQAGGALTVVAAVAVAGAFAVRSAVWTDAAPVPPADESGQEIEQMPIIRQMTNALNAKDTDAFMDVFARDGWFTSREHFLANRNWAGALVMKSDAALIEAWMAINEAWDLEAEVIDCKPDTPRQGLLPPELAASNRSDVLAVCQVRTRWHALSLEVTEEWSYEFDGTTLLTWGRTALLDINTPGRTLPLGVDGLLDWERWLKANRPEDAGRYLSPRWTGPKRDDYMEPPYPACAHGGPCLDVWIDNREAWDNTKFAPFANTTEKHWSINGQDYAPSGLVPYNPAYADEIEASIQAYLDER